MPIVPNGWLPEQCPGSIRMVHGRVHMGWKPRLLPLVSIDLSHANDDDSSDMQGLISLMGDRLEFTSGAVSPQKKQPSRRSLFQRPSLPKPDPKPEKPSVKKPSPKDSQKPSQYVAAESDADKITAAELEYYKSQAFEDDLGPA